jgi:hypothetical protein
MDHLTDLGAFIEGLANTKAAGDVAVARPPAKRARTAISVGMEEQSWGDFLTCTIQ